MSNAAAAFAEPNNGEDDYQAFYAVLAASERGRAFLAEHARRTRQAEIETLLAALTRLENRMAAQTQAAPPDRALHALAGLLEALRGLQAQIDLQRMSADVARLAGLIDSVRVRLEDIVPEPVRPAFAPVAAPKSIGKSAGLALSAVAAQALAAAQPAEPEVRVFKAGSIPKPTRFAGDDFSAAENTADDAHESAPPACDADPDADMFAAQMDTADPQPWQTGGAIEASPDPLSPILTLTEEERLALFA